MPNETYVIAEAGVNHNGDPDLAFQLVDVAVEAGADAVKFQTFKAEKLVTKSAEKADYQKHTTDNQESQFEMLKQLELANETYYELYNYCKIKGIEFLSTAFDSDSLSFLTDKLGIKKLKIPSGEITNGPFILEHAYSGRELILSTGMACLDEVKEALSVIAFGLLYGNDMTKSPCRSAFEEAFNTQEAKHLLKEKVTLLHCTTEYPAPFDDINLNAMQTMRSEFDLNVGYSDHSVGITVPIAAVALGAKLIEKHFTLDRTLPGPDHMASLEPEQLKEMIKSIRTVQKIMGDGVKEAKPSELGNRDIARKSLVAACDIEIGEEFNRVNLAIKRPGTGRSPMDYWDLLGSKAHKRISADEVIK